MPFIGINNDEIQADLWNILEHSEDDSVYIAYEMMSHDNLVQDVNVYIVHHIGTTLTKRIFRFRK